MPNITATFTDSNGQIVKYNGSPLAWRISAYSVISKEDKVFLIRGQGEKLYDVVGGEVEIGESIESALKREALEEAGLTISPGKLIDIHQDYFYHRKEKKFYQTLLLYYKATPIGKPQQPHDKNIRFSQFVEISEFKKYPTLPFVRKIINSHHQLNSM